MTYRIIIGRINSTSLWTWLHCHYRFISLHRLHISVPLCMISCSLLQLFHAMLSDVLMLSHFSITDTYVDWFSLFLHCLPHYSSFVPDSHVISFVALCTANKFDALSAIHSLSTIFTSISFHNFTRVCF